MLTILTEKPSAGRNFANALGGMQGTFNGEEYTIISARGHLLTLLEPSKQVPEEKIDWYRRWRIETLPWVYDDFAWKKTIVKMAGANRVMEAMQNTFSESDEVVIATDVDPSGEGELLPLADDIAALVGIDPVLLTHRHMRKTHVDEKAGAHGANRPGPKPPASLEELEKRFGEIACEIYTVLARNYLAMLAEDYEYLQQKGHLKDYPGFTGTANIPLKSGYKEIFDSGTKEDEPTNEFGKKGHPSYTKVPIRNRKSRQSTTHHLNPKGF